VTEDAELSQISELLFGRPIRLWVARWILQRRGKPFYQSLLIKDLPIRFGTNSVDVLNDMAKLGMLRALPKDTVEGRQRVYYEPLRHRLWDCVRIAVSVAAEAHPRGLAASGRPLQRTIFSGQKGRSLAKTLTAKRASLKTNQAHDADSAS